MRFSSLITARPAPEDRSPLIIGGNGVSTNIAPHGAVTRWTYTVPIGRKARVSTAWMRWRRVTAAAPPGIVQINIQVTSSMLGDIRTTKNAVDDGESMVFSGATYLPSSGNILQTDQDASTGGTADYGSAFSGVEYDA